MDLVKMIETGRLIDFSKPLDVLLACVFFIGLIAGCGKVLTAQKYEMLLMTEKERRKIYYAKLVMLFAGFSAINFFTTLGEPILILCGTAIIISFFLFVVLSIVNLFLKKSEIEFWIRVINCVIFFAIILFFCCLLISASIANKYCIILVGALIELLYVCVYFNSGLFHKSTLKIIENGKEYYVYDQINDELLICGESNDIYSCGVRKFIPKKSVFEGKAILEIEKMK